tara:strand:+ start:390 stop:986 length:597 start_codon:yes stop_codon:yes gene_type:complete
MIKFIKLRQEKPYLIFKEKYEEAYEKGQKNIEAIAISSYNKENMEVDSRFVNLKFIEGNEFIFFSNFNSPKSISFKSHNQISALFYWSSINVQIRMKALINRKPHQYNQSYFKTRSTYKNALAISSSQSKEIKSFEDVIKKYNYTKERKDLTKCPSYWGGFAFIPYHFEFWVGNDSRLNKRDLYKIKDDEWNHTIIEP